jgi:hypothetical protein
MASDAQVLDQQLEGQGVMSLARGRDRPQRPTPGIGEQVDLGAQAPTGPAERLPIGVVPL